MEVLIKRFYLLYLFLHRIVQNNVYFSYLLVLQCMFPEPCLVLSMCTSCLTNSVNAVMTSLPSSFIPVCRPPELPAEAGQHLVRQPADTGEVQLVQARSHRHSHHHLLPRPRHLLLVCAQNKGLSSH